MASYLDYEQKILTLIESDALRMKALRHVSSLALPDWLIAAGFVRNAVWNHLFNTAIKLNDVDVIYFCPVDVSERRDEMLENRLRLLAPEIPWSVKNQARMHKKNSDSPYSSAFHAMSYWPEKQTAVGVKLSDTGAVLLRHSFDLSYLFNSKINQNPIRAKELFELRLRQKRWLETWPELGVEYS